MTKYAKERIFRDPDGNLITEREVKDGQSGGLGTSLAYAEGDAIEGDDEAAAGKLGTGTAPAATPAMSLSTASGDSPSAATVTIGSNATVTETVTEPKTRSKKG